MPHHLIRPIAAALGVLGVVAGVIGLWFMTQLGTDGRATFTAEPGSQTVVLNPSVLNRVDSDVVVEARAEGAVWMGLARPSDAESVMKDAKAARAVDVSVQSWELGTVTSGSAEADPKSYDLWQAQRTGSGSASITITQAAAPQTLVVAAEDEQQLDSVTMSVSDSGWFTRAVLLTLTGLVLVALAGYLLLRGRRNGDDGADDGDPEASSPTVSDRAPRGSTAAGTTVSDAKETDR